MRITVSYHVRDTYGIPDEKWREAMALCGNDEDDALDFLMDEGLSDYDRNTDVTDRYVEVAEEKDAEEKYS
jgi:hypothetical protein